MALGSSHERFQPPLQYSNENELIFLVCDNHCSVVRLSTLWAVIVVLQHAALGLGHIYQANPEWPWYNYYLACPIRSCCSTTITAQRVDNLTTPQWLSQTKKINSFSLLYCRFVRGVSIYWSLSKYWLWFSV